MKTTYNEDELARMAGFVEEEEDARADAVWEAEDAAVMKKSKKGRAVASKVCVGVFVWGGGLWGVYRVGMVTNLWIEKERWVQNDGCRTKGRIKGRIV